MTDKEPQLFVIETIKQSVRAKIVPQPFAEGMVQSAMIPIC